jgi:type II restriction/modification system DNA methylase subunit YeeA
MAKVQSQEELLKQPTYIPHRPKKDPRDLKILDRACRSGHFLLYCFDLLQTIYEEAYDDPGIGPPSRRITRRWMLCGARFLA